VQRGERGADGGSRTATPRAVPRVERAGPPSPWTSAPSDRLVAARAAHRRAEHTLAVLLANLGAGRHVGLTARPAAVGAPASKA